MAADTACGLLPGEGLAGAAGGAELCQRDDHGDLPAAEHRRAAAGFFYLPGGGGEAGIVVSF